MHGLYIWASSVRDLSLRWCNAQLRISRLMRVNAFGLAAGWKLCAKMRLSGFTQMTSRARNWKPRKSKWMLGKSLRRFASCVTSDRAVGGSVETAACRGDAGEKLGRRRVTGHCLGKIDQRLTTAISGRPGTYRGDRWGGGSDKERVEI